jgi:CxxC-x17-CxxC domain-containing protein
LHYLSEPDRGLLKKNPKKGEKNKMAEDRFGREMTKVTCSECGKETEVPFKPDGSRPVYCRECFMKHRKPFRERRE